MDLDSLIPPDPFWIGVGILIHRYELTRLEAVAAMHVMAESNQRDVAAQAAALIAEVVHAG